MGARSATEQHQRGGVFARRARYRPREWSAVGEAIPARARRRLPGSGVGQITITLPIRELSLGQGQKIQQISHGTPPLGRVTHRQVSVHFVPVRTPRPMSADIPRPFQIIKNALHGTLRNPCLSCNFSGRQALPITAGQAQQNLRVVG